MASFRLLQLPQSAILEVLRSIEIFELTIFSLLSNKTKNLVKLLEKSPFTSIKLHCGEQHISIYIYASDWRIICAFEFYRTMYVTPANLNLIRPVVVEVKKLIRGDVYEQFSSNIRENYGMRDWLNHFLAITKVRKIQLLIEEETRFNYDSIFQTLNGINIEHMHFYDLALLRYTHRIPSVIFDNSLENIHDKHKVLMQNWDFLCLCCAEITLDDLLIANCSSLQLPTSGYYFKDLNRYLKLWKRGVMRSSRMEHLSIGYLNDEDEDEIHLNMNGLIGVILDGIDHNVIEQGVERRLVKFNNFGVDIRGGYDIINVLGRRVTIVFDTEEFFIDIYFWPA